MFKRILLAMTFAATLGGASLFMTDKAEARRWGWGYNQPYVSNYYGPRVYNYGYGVPYRASYGGYYGPRAYNYGYTYPRGYYYGGPGVRVGVGFGPFWR